MLICERGQHWEGDICRFVKNTNRMRVLLSSVFSMALLLSEVPRLVYVG